MQLPIHIASSSGNKSLLKRLIDSVSPQVLEIKNESGKTPLMLAVSYNYIDCAGLLLKAGVHADNSDSSGQTSLHIAIHKGFHRCVKLLLSFKASYQQKDFLGVTPLHIAAINPNSKCLLAILKLLKLGETDIQDCSMKTALHWCSAYGNADHVKMLLTKGANICIPDDQGKTPLHWAATNPNLGALECVKILLEKEGSLINWQDYEGRSALHLAVATGSLEVVRFLVSKDTCDTDILDNAFCTPLHWAAKRGLFDKVDILLKKSLYASADDSFATPLQYAAYHNHAKTVEVFLSRTFINDVGDINGRFALLWAAARNADAVIEVMARNGCEITSADKNGMTALHVAAIQGHITTIKLLIKLNVPLNLKDNCGMTALLRACEFGRAKAAKLLLELGAQIADSDDNKLSVLHWCAIGGHAYLCQNLLNKGISCNLQDGFGRTPLHYACMKKGYLNCVSVLLESDANPNIMDNEGKLPLHWAIFYNHEDIIKLLCDHDADVNTLIFRNEWLTCLDLAAQNKQFKIIQLLKMYGGLSSSKIKQIAAGKIQLWYKRIHSSNHASCSSNFADSKSLLITKLNASEQMDTNQAAIIIQRTWKNYSTKKKFLNMQKTIHKKYGTVQKRVAAEKLWCKKLMTFLEEYN